MGHALQLELLAGFLDLREEDAFRHRLHQLVEQMHDLRALALQFLDDFHARHEPLLAVFQILNVGDLRIELENLFLQKSVLLVLPLYPAAVENFSEADQNDAGNGGTAQGDHEFATSNLTFLFAPGK
jgi:hypothetical protein